MAQVALQGVGKTYPGSRGREGVRAVHAVDLDIADGEFVVLVGPSGCGKSTLLRMIAGLEEITAGTLSIDGRVVNDLPARDRDIAFVFQNYALYPHMSVWQNMAFGLERRRRYPSLLKAFVSGDYREERRAESKSITERVTKAAETLGLAGHLDRQPRELSGGQRQRVAVGRAIVRDPKVFLFDEPLSNLDAKLRIEMRSELRDLHRRLRATMVYVTHDQEEAMSLGDRLVVLKDGIVQQIGKPAEVYAKPANRFVAGFVGTPAMNFVEGRLHRSEAGERFVSDALTVELPRGSAAAATPGPITLGLRPDRLAIGADAAPRPWRGEATVRTVELLGDRADLVLDLRGQRLTCRAATEGLPGEGATVALGLDPRDCHLFGEDGRRVTA